MRIGFLMPRSDNGEQRGYWDSLLETALEAVTVLYNVYISERNKLTTKSNL